MAAFVLLMAKIFYAVAVLLLIGAVLLQEGKGGGLAALGGTRAETAFGSSNPVRRLTVVLAVIFFIFASGLSYYQGRRGVLEGVGAAETGEEPAGGKDGAGETDAAEPAGDEQKPPAPGEAAPEGDTPEGDAPENDAPGDGAPAEDGPPAGGAGETPGEAGGE